MLLCRGGKAVARADEASRDVADDVAATPRLGLEASGEASLPSVRIPDFISVLGSQRVFFVPFGKADAAEDG